MSELGFNWPLGTEATVRLVLFASIFSVMATWEVLAARRALSAPKGRRWVANLSLVVLDSAIVRLAFPAAAVGAALAAEEAGWGLLRLTEMPLWLATTLSLVVLDLVVYLQHRVFHAVPALWRLHKVHHADVDFDVTTGLRFHPIEILLSMLLKAGVVMLLGAPATAVLVFEVLLNGLAIFNHGNVRIPAGLERVVRWFVVTPEMHRVHHSTEREEYDTNFGFNLSLWDRLLDTYKAQPAAGHEGMSIGLPDYRGRKWISLPRLLAIPFLRRPGPEDG